MKGQIVILPGTPDDDNRDYLPEIIKTTDIVVNENGNNSQVYPARLTEHTGVLVEGQGEDTWYEYVPATYDPTRKTPLVFAMHGGMMTGWGQAIYTSWTLVADRDGFIVVFPNAHASRFWQVEWDPAKLAKGLEPGLHQPPPSPADNPDNKLVLALLEKMKVKYNIDEGRIFMQGMSMGDMMTNQFARHFGNLLAGAAGSGASVGRGLLFDADGQVKNRGGHLAIWQSRPERNGFPRRPGGEQGQPPVLAHGQRVHALAGDQHPVVKTISPSTQAPRPTWSSSTSRTATTARRWTMPSWSGITSFPAPAANRTAGSSTRRPVAPRTGDAFAIAIAKDCRKPGSRTRPSR